MRGGQAEKTAGRKRKARGLKSLIASDLLLLLCACLLLYPIVSDVWNGAHSSRILADYRETVEAMDQADLDAARAAAEAYNAELSERGNSRFSMSAEERARYGSLMHVGNTDEMAFVTCEKIGVSALPVYHGTTSEVLQAGVGHYEGSSLPVGGASTHCVLSGHSGMAGLKMFSELSRLENGDVFQVEALGETMYYEVDEINRVKPADLSHLDIRSGEDECTLITCIPIGLNSERLLVRGHRVDAPQAEDATPGGADAGENALLSAWAALTTRFAGYELAMCAGALLILLGVLVPDAARGIARARGRRAASAKAEGGENETPGTDGPGAKAAGEEPGAPDGAEKRARRRDAGTP